MIRLFKSNDENTCPSVRFGADEIRAQDATSHFLVAGATGSGKTVTINRMLQDVLPVIRDGHDWRAVVYDGKTEAVSALNHFALPKEKLFILHPFDARAHAWDIASDIQTVGEMQELSRLLFPPEKTHAPFFENAANDLLQGVMLSFAQRFGTEWTLRDVLLAFRQRSWLQAILAWAPEHNAARRSLYFKNARTANDVLATIRTKVAPFEVIAAYWDEAYREGRRVSLQQWAREGAVLVLGHSHRNTDAVNRINRVIFQRLTQVILDEPNSNLDAEGEEALVRTLNDLKQSGVTVVVVAHRPSLLAGVDMLLVLKDGVVELFGPRAEVIARVTRSMPPVRGAA